MEKSAALKLIEKHRQFWRSRESDADIARRAERIYLGIGLMFIGFGLIDLVDSVSSDRLTSYRISFAAIVFSAGALLCWQSYRFALVRRLFTDAESDSN